MGARTTVHFQKLVPALDTQGVRCTFHRPATYAIMYDGKQLGYIANQRPGSYSYKERSDGWVVLDMAGYGVAFVDSLNAAKAAALEYFGEPHHRRRVYRLEAHRGRVFSEDGHQYLITRTSTEPGEGHVKFWVHYRGEDGALRSIGYMGVTQEDAAYAAALSLDIKEA